MEKLFTYPGSKTNELKHIIPNIPQFSGRYFESFTGSGAVGHHIEHPNSFMNEISYDIFTLFDAIQENKKCNKLLTDLQKLMRPVYTKEYYNQLRAQYNLERQKKNPNPAYFLMMRELGYAGQFKYKKDGTYNTYFGGKTRSRRNINNNLLKIIQANNSSFYQNAQFCNVDFEEFFEIFDFNKNDFIFLDPPYDGTWSGYDDKEFGNTEHETLAGLLKKSKAKWMLSYQDTKYIRNLYKGYRIVSYELKRRSGITVRHLLIMNYGGGK